MTKITIFRSRNRKNVSLSMGYQALMLSMHAYTA